MEHVEVEDVFDDEIEDDDDDWEPDYVEDWHLGQRRHVKRYSKAAPMLALSSRMSAFRQHKRTNEFAKKYRNLLIMQERNERPYKRLLCTRIDGEYFVLNFIASSYDTPPPDPMIYMGQPIRIAPMSAGKIVAKVELVYRDKNKLYERIKKLNEIVRESRCIEVPVLGETFYIGHFSVSLHSGGFDADIELVCPTHPEFAVHADLRHAEQGRKKAFAKHITIEQVLKNGH